MGRAAYLARSSTQNRSPVASEWSVPFSITGERFRTRSSMFVQLRKTDVPYKPVSDAVSITSKSAVSHVTESGHGGHEVKLSASGLPSAAKPLRSQCGVDVDAYTIRDRGPDQVIRESGSHESLVRLLPPNLPRRQTLESRIGRTVFSSSLPL